MAAGRIICRIPAVGGRNGLDDGPVQLFFEVAPSLTARDYLPTVFRELSRLPAARELFD